MKFKIDKRKRIKIPDSLMWDIVKKHYDLSISFSQFINKFESDTGLLKTSSRVHRSRRLKGRITSPSTYFYYFKVVDEHKYMLAKIKYGF